MLLIHDLGEIDADDIMLYEPHDTQQRHQQEKQGITRLFAHLPPSQQQRYIDLLLWSN